MFLILTGAVVPSCIHLSKLIELTSHPLGWLLLKQNKMGLPWQSSGTLDLRLCASTAGGTGSIPGQGTKIPHGAAKKQKQKQNKTENNKCQ